MDSSSCLHLVRLAAIHPCNLHRQQQIFRKPVPLLASSAYVRAGMIRASCSFPNPQLITQKYKLQFFSPKTQQNPNFFFTSSSSSSTKSSTVCMQAALYEANTSSKIIQKIPATEIFVVVFVYIIPFFNHRLNLLTKFPVLRLAMTPIRRLLGFYQSIPALGLIAILALFIGFARYRGRNFTTLDLLRAIVLDCLVVIASLIHSDPLARGAALGFKFRLLNVFELLSFQTCLLTCLNYLEAVPWWVVSCPSMNTLSNIMAKVLKTDGNEGRRVGKSMVVKLLREKDSLLSDVNFAETCNKIILSSCQSCLDSLQKLFKRAARVKYFAGYYNESADKQVSLEVNNLLWLLDILVERQAAEGFALMWANQRKLANLHTKFWMPSRRLVSCITTRLLVGIGNGEILLANDTRQLLLLTWFQPLVDDYTCLQRLPSFDRIVVEENIEKIILELTQRINSAFCWHGLDMFWMVMSVQTFKKPLKAGAQKHSLFQ